MNNLLYKIQDLFAYIDEQNLMCKVAFVDLFFFFLFKQCIVMKRFRRHRYAAKINVLSVKSKLPANVEL